ncbi:MAG: hypothetical protein AB7F64_04535, partial [Gammaproteobacteria bacterium]
FDPKIKKEGRKNIIQGLASRKDLFRRTGMPNLFELLPQSGQTLNKPLSKNVIKAMATTLSNRNDLSTEQILCLLKRPMWLKGNDPCESQVYENIIKQSKLLEASVVNQLIDRWKHLPMDSYEFKEQGALLIRRVDIKGDSLQNMVDVLHQEKNELDNVAWIFCELSKREDLLEAHFDILLNFVKINTSRYTGSILTSLADRSNLTQKQFDDLISILGDNTTPISNDDRIKLAEYLASRKLLDINQRNILLEKAFQIHQNELQKPHKCVYKKKDYYSFRLFNSDAKSSNVSSVLLGTLIKCLDLNDEDYKKIIKWGQNENCKGIWTIILSRSKLTESQFSILVDLLLDNHLDESIHDIIGKRFEDNQLKIELNKHHLLRALEKLHNSADNESRNSCKAYVISRLVCIPDLSEDELTIITNALRGRTKIALAYLVLYNRAVDLRNIGRKITHAVHYFNYDPDLPHVNGVQYVSILSTLCITQEASEQNINRLFDVYENLSLDSEVQRYFAEQNKMVVLKILCAHKLDLINDSLFHHCIRFHKDIAFTWLLLQPIEFKARYTKLYNPYFSTPDETFNLFLKLHEKCFLESNAIVTFDREAKKLSINGQAFGLFENPFSATGEIDLVKTDNLSILKMCVSDSELDGLVKNGTNAMKKISWVYLSNEDLQNKLLSIFHWFFGKASAINIKLDLIYILYEFKTSRGLAGYLRHFENINVRNLIRNIFMIAIHAKDDSVITQLKSIIGFLHLNSSMSSEWELDDKTVKEIEDLVDERSMTP